MNKKYKKSTMLQLNKVIFYFIRVTQPKWSIPNVSKLITFLFIHLLFGYSFLLRDNQTAQKLNVCNAFLANYI